MILLCMSNIRVLSAMPYAFAMPYALSMSYALAMPYIIGYACHHQFTEGFMQYANPIKSQMRKYISIDDRLYKKRKQFYQNFVYPSVKCYCHFTLNLLKYM